MAGKKRNGIILGLALCLCMTIFSHVSALANQEPAFRMDMDSLNLQLGVSGNIVISLINAQGAESLMIDGIEDFDIVSQSQSTSSSIVNGETTHRLDLHYTVMPKTVGQFTLKAYILYNGQYHETNELPVTVSEGSDGGAESARNLFIQTVMSHTEAFEGEKVVVTYELYSRYNIDNFGFTEPIVIDGVLVKEIANNQFNAEYVYIDGKRYVMYEVRQLIIDPIRPGVYTIPSFNFQVNVITDGRGFFRSTTPMFLQTEDKELTIKPLPSIGRPPEFSDIVGELRLDGNYSRVEMNYGESFILNVTASGNCNFDGLRNIINMDIPGVSVFETLRNMTESVENNQYHVQKSFEAIMIPERTGVLDIAPISISYFNPVTEKYEIAEIPGATIEVFGDMPHPSGNIGNMVGAMETLIINQVNYSHENDGYFTLQVKKEWAYGILIGFAALLVISVVLFKVVSNSKKQDHTLKTLFRQLIAANDTNEIYNLFNAMIKHCYKLSLKASSQSMIRSQLPDAGLAEQIADVMSYMEVAKTHEQNQKGHIYLKDKINSIYRMLLQLQKS